MRWVTRERPKTDRIACPWLTRRFIDPTAEILDVPADQVLDVALREGARSVDTPGAGFTHRPDGPDTFEVAGGILTEPDDHALLERGSFVYDALYPWCEADVGRA